MDTNRNLLFALLALQLNFVNCEQLVAVMEAWLHDRSSSIGDFFVEKLTIDDEQRKLLEALVNKQIEMHGGSVEQSLRHLSSLESDVRERLFKLNDGELGTTLQFISAKTVNPSVQNTSEKGRQSECARFRVIRLHAKGGQGEVYVAHDTELFREVALKEIQKRYANEIDVRERFRREAEITGKLEHPGIVPVYGLGQYDDGRPFYAMRFIRGESLKEAIDAFHEKYRNGLTDSDALPELRKLLQRLVDVCNAMAYAHSRGVLHRDLKPGNIILGSYGETLVVDWGLAKANGEIEKGDKTTGPVTTSVGSGVTPTAMGAVIGTPAYMSPEQAAGRLNELSTASDVYSLGATLFHLLTGELPIKGKSALEVVSKVVAGEVRRPRQLKKSVPKALESICLKAMARLPKDRYSDALELAEDIERWLSDARVLAHRDSILDSTKRWIRNNLLLAISLVFCIVFSLGVFFAGLGTVFAMTFVKEGVAVQSSEAAQKMIASIASDDFTKDPIQTRQKLLEMAVEYMETQLNQPGLPLNNSASIHRVIATLYFERGMPKEAGDAWHAACLDYSRLLKTDSTRSNCEAFVYCCLQECSIRVTTGDTQIALELCDSAEATLREYSFLFTTTESLRIMDEIRKVRLESEGGLP